MENKILSQVHLDIDTHLHILHLLTSTSCLFPLIHCNGLEKLKGKILVCAWLNTLMNYTEWTWWDTLQKSSELFEVLHIVIVWRKEKVNWTVQCCSNRKFYMYEMTLFRYLSVIGHWVTRNEWKMVLTVLFSSMEEGGGAICKMRFRLFIRTVELPAWDDFILVELENVLCWSTASETLK